MPPAARVGDNHGCFTHGGGVIQGPGCELVLVGGKPAARRLDRAACGGVMDAIALGSFSVLIGGQPAARMGDQCAHGGEITEGSRMVLIGDPAPSGGASRTFATAEEAARAAPTTPTPGPSPPTVSSEG
jgi:uncharacterized Zn-binding protein involved in type VI secretion